MKQMLVAIVAILLVSIGACHPHASTTPECNSTTGLSHPLEVCTTSNPCTKPLPTQTTNTITNPTEIPTCKNTSGPRAIVDDSPPLSRTDLSGDTRYVCLHTPTGASPASKRPLLVYFHGSGATADVPYVSTSLLTKAEDAATKYLGGPGGFFILSIQGKNLHWPTDGFPRDASHHDIHYRKFSGSDMNPDVDNADRWIDTVVAQGKVDTDRIYTMGWSNGGFFAEMYGIIRKKTPTPGGNYTAAVSVFSAADPFNNRVQGETPSCQLDPYPRSDIPIQIVSRVCDVIACDQTQANGLTNQGGEIEPGQIVAPWFSDALSKSGVVVNWLGIAGYNIGSIVTNCTNNVPCTPYCVDDTSVCTNALALGNHVVWPDDVAVASQDREPDMLAFLKSHPLH